MLGNRCSGSIVRIAAAAVLGWVACGPSEPGIDGFPGPGAAAEYSFEYGVELEDERADGGMRPVGRDFRFRSGDGFRFAFRADFDAYVYMFNRSDGAETYAALVPGARSRVNNPILAGDSVLLPGEPQWLRFDRERGWEHFVMVVSLTPQAAFEAVGASIRRDEFERVLARIESLQAPASRSSVTEDDWTREFFSAGAQDMAVAVRLPLAHD